MSIASGAAAGGGADAIEQLLARAFAEQQARVRSAQEDQRIKIEQQRADDERAYRLKAMASLDEDRAAKQRDAAETSALKLTNVLAPDTVMSPDDPAAKTLIAGNLSPLVPADKTLDSVNIGGAANGDLAATPNPGKLTGQLRYIGTPAQQQMRAQGAARERFMAGHPDVADA